MYKASPVHPNSLVDSTTHSPALLELTNIKVSRPVIEYLVDCVVETVDYAMGRPSPSTSRGRSRGRRPEHAKFTTFVKNVIERAEITIQTLLVTLVYIDRAKPHLHIALEEWALERVFLGAIIVASKYLNDSTLKNVHWALCTGVFGKRDVGRIEREYLDVLDFELGITEADILSHHQGLLNAVYPSSHPYRTNQLQFTHPHSSANRTSSSNASSAPVPELSPSSDESSSGSASPRTPSTLESSPAYSPEHGKHNRTKSSHSKKSSFSSSTLELLRSFPIPLPQSAHQRQEHSHMSVRVRS
ncbi:hypothetical protein D9756_001210 [Leucocoprinus leucothites]|uniref:Cyclin-like domain-containing protein n=1 Tax=Leucocoprinus leucothites TaxID=201217 RepID=A0A8H5G473_9AGAR|nr:hypothetical protein D9756_001210 [Leucoagaricus leucothites]